MKLWRFSDPHDYRYARASRVGGTWQEGEYRDRKENILIEWEPDSDLVGDFTWPGLDTDVLVAERVAETLRGAEFQGFELRSVEMVENSEPAKRRSKKPRVRLPYSGPTLLDLWVTAWTALDRKRSTITAVQREDGSEYYEVSGVQRREKLWDQHRKELTTQVRPRIPGEGLFVPEIRGIFRIEEFPGWIFCTDDVKLLIEGKLFTNVSFLEMGDVVGE